LLQEGQASALVVHEQTRQDNESFRTLSQVCTTI